MLKIYYLHTQLISIFLLRIESVAQYIALPTPSFETLRNFRDVLSSIANVRRRKTPHEAKFKFVRQSANKRQFLATSRFKIRTDKLFLIRRVGN